MSLITVDPGQKDIKKITGNVVGIAIIAALGLAAYTYVLPYLLTLVWDSVQLGIGIVVAAFLFYILTNGKTWRAFRYLSEAFSQIFLGWVIEMNPFNILEYKLRLAEEDAEELLKYNKQLKGKQSEIKEKIDRNDQEIKIAISQKDIVQRKLLANPADITAKEGLEESLNTIAANTDYANGLKPAYNELVKLTDFTERAFRAANLQIKMSRKQLSKQRDLYETVTTASGAITKAKRALAGDAGVNSDADMAIEMLRKDIGQKIGNIQSGIKITSEIMNSKDLENAAKLQTTLKQLEGVDLHEVPYSSTIASNAPAQMQIASSGENPYLDFLK
jgi:hypothetical protein